MKLFLNTILAILFLAIALPAQSQIGKGRTFDWKNDTLTNADTINLAPLKKLEGVYDYTWQVSVENVSDTTNVTGYVEERLLDTGPWYPTDTISFTDTGTTIITGTTIGFEHRIRLLSANTGVTALNSRVWYRRKD